MYGWKCFDAARLNRRLVKCETDQNMLVCVCAYSLAFARGFGYQIFDFRQVFFFFICIIYIRLWFWSITIKQQHYIYHNLCVPLLFIGQSEMLRERESKKKQIIVGMIVSCGNFVCRTNEMQEPNNFGLESLQAKPNKKNWRWKRTKRKYHTRRNFQWNQPFGMFNAWKEAKKRRRKNINETIQWSN